MAFFSKRSGRWPASAQSQGRRETVLIVGGSRGLGLDLARSYAERGAQVALCARDPLEVERARNELSEAGNDVFAAVCDATVETQIREFVTATLEHFGSLDVLVTCAATIQVGPLALMEPADFEEAMQQIFWSTFHATMAVLPHMRSARSGRIVHVTSFGGKLAVPHLAPYSTAKFAATGFSSALRVELAKDGISVTTVAPGLLRTGAHTNAPFKGQHEQEYGWFSAGATLPFVSLPSMRAARRIIHAADKRKAEVTLSAAVRVAIIANAIAPGLVSRLLSLQNALLPSERGGSTELVRGMDVVARSRSPLVKAIAAYGRANAEAHHAYPGPIHVDSPWIKSNDTRIRWS